MSANAVWELLQTHPLYLAGTLDIGQVCERLREKMQSDSTTPVLSRSIVYSAIEEVCRNGRIANLRQTPALAVAMAAH